MAKINNKMTKYHVIHLMIRNDEKEHVVDEWQISKAIISDNAKEFLALTSKANEIKLKSLNTFEPNLDLLTTAAKNCKKEICKILFEYYRHLFNPNWLVEDGTPIHWLVKSNLISVDEAQKNTKKYYQFCETFECLISNGCDVNIKDSKGFTPLHYAAMQDNYGAATMLLNHRHTIIEEADTHAGMTPLHVAARYGSETVALLLIDAMSPEQLSLLDFNKMHALHHACKCKIQKYAIVERIIAKYAATLGNRGELMDTLSRKDKFENTTLDLAIKENHLRIVECLLESNSAQFRLMSDHDNNLPIHIAAKFGSVEMLALMERYECVSFEPNSSWNNVFHIAATANKFDFMEELRTKFEGREEMRFALNTFNLERHTPLLCAIASGSLECVSLLLKSAETAVTIDMFEVCIESNQTRTLKYLLEYNKRKVDMLSSLVSKDASNNTILHFVCIHRNFEMFKMIVNDVIDGELPVEIIDWKNQNNKSAFSIACKNGCLEIVEYFLSLRRSDHFINYDPLHDRDDEYSTPLHYAAKTNQVRILELLIENGADVNALNKYDKIPLHYSCELGSFEISRLLVDHKSKVNACDVFNMSPIDYSCQIGHNEIVRYLLDHAARVHDIDNDHYNCLDIAIERHHKAVVETLLNNRHLAEFLHFEDQRASKIDKLVKIMPLTMKVLLDNCYDATEKRFHFDLLDHPKYRATVDHPLWIMAHYRYKYLLGHKTVKKLVELKMRKLPRIFFWINLGFYLIFLLLLTFHHVNSSIFNSKHQLLIHLNQTIDADVTTPTIDKTFYLWPLPYSFTMFDESGTRFFWFYKSYFFLMLLVYLLKKVFQIYNYGLKMFRSIEHWLEIFCFICNILSTLPFPNAASAFGSFAVLFGWISFAFFFQSIAIFKLGSYSIALRKTIQNSFKFLPFFFMIYFGFLCSFKIRENYGVNYFNSTISQVVKTITMMVGELQSSRMGIEPSDIDLNFIANNVIYICFVFVMCIIVLDLFIGIEVGEIKTVIDEAETQNIAMNSIYVLKVQEVVYRLYAWASGDTRPTFMSVLEHSQRLSADRMTHVERRPDLLNRIENFLISMSHSFDQHVDEQLKQMRELKEQVVIIMQQLDVLKKRLASNDNSSSPRGGANGADLLRKTSVFGTDEPRLSRLMSELAATPAVQSSEADLATFRKPGIARNTTF